MGQHAVPKESVRSEMDSERCFDHAQRLAALEESSKRAHKRMDAMESLTKSVNDLANSVGKMTVEMTQLKENSADLNHKIDCLEAAPAKRWELIVTEIIKLIVAGAAGFLISMLF